MRNLCAASLAVVSALTLSVSAQAATITITCGSVGVEQPLFRDAIVEWEAQTGHDVEIVAPPTSTSDQLALYRQMPNSGSADIDIFQVDVIRPGILGSHFIDPNPYLDQENIDANFDGIIAGPSRGDELLAMPWFTDAPMLYFRAHLLEKYGLDPPETWDEMTAAAQTIQGGERAAGNDRFWGFVWQGKICEGLTCDALEWVKSHNGGLVVEADGAVARPSSVTGERHNEVSNSFWNAIHAILSGNGDTATNLAQLERELVRSSRGGRW